MKHWQYSLAFHKRSWRINFNVLLSVKGIRLFYSVVKEHRKKKIPFRIYRVGEAEKGNQSLKLFLFLSHQHSTVRCILLTISKIFFASFTTYLSSNQPFNDFLMKNLLSIPYRERNYRFNNLMLKKVLFLPHNTIWQRLICIIACERILLFLLPLHIGTATVNLWRFLKKILNFLPFTTYLYRKMRFVTLSWKDFDFSSFHTTLSAYIEFPSLFRKFFLLS